MYSNQENLFFHQRKPYEKTKDKSHELLIWSKGKMNIISHSFQTKHTLNLIWEEINGILSKIVPHMCSLQKLTYDIYFTFQSII